MTEYNKNICKVLVGIVIGAHGNTVKDQQTSANIKFVELIEMLS